MTSTPPTLCCNCGKEITDHNSRPRAALCPACRLAARQHNIAANRPPGKRRVCKHCGGEITDLDDHPGATTCPACRSASTRLAPAIPIVRAYVDSQGWPTYLKAAKVLDENPEMVAQITAHSKTAHRKTYARLLFTEAVKEVVGPQGQHYVEWMGGGRTLRVTFPDGMQREAVTCE